MACFILWSIPPGGSTRSTSDPVRKAPRPWWCFIVKLVSFHWRRCCGHALNFDVTTWNGKLLLLRPKNSKPGTRIRSGTNWSESQDWVWQNGSIVPPTKFPPSSPGSTFHLHVQKLVARWNIPSQQPWRAQWHKHPINIACSFDCNCDDFNNYIGFNMAILPSTFNQVSFRSDCICVCTLLLCLWLLLEIRLLTAWERLFIWCLIVLVLCYLPGTVKWN